MCSSDGRPLPHPGTDAIHVIKWTRLSSSVFHSIHYPKLDLGMRLKKMSQHIGRKVFRQLILIQQIFCEIYVYTKSQLWLANFEPRLSVPDCLPALEKIWKESLDDITMPLQFSPKLNRYKSSPSRKHNIWKKNWAKQGCCLASFSGPRRRRKDLVSIIFVHALDHREIPQPPHTIDILLSFHDA